MTTWLSSIKKQWWPEIPDREIALKLSRQGLLAAILQVLLALGFAYRTAFKAALSGVNTTGFLIAAVIFSVIALGIWKHSRLAAVVGLVLLVPHLIWVFLDIRGVADAVTGVLVTALFVSLYVNGVRGTFMYHRFTPGDASPDALHSS